MFGIRNEDSGSALAVELRNPIAKFVGGTAQEAAHLVMDRVISDANASSDEIVMQLVEHGLIAFAADGGGDDLAGIRIGVFLVHEGCSPKAHQPAAHAVKTEAQFFFVKIQIFKRFTAFSQTHDYTPFYLVVICVLLIGTTLF
ncbi:hypothetical protein QE408_000380 [Agrobacterium larrymoorei]|uniref:Uncharacterized protein n=1 Tax=Agrobacterium larrymoorei TaxID=160699 RepID=A0ABU0UED2_9HYPH|nr:hypothetical protein [Agrobacterium larrymoorei]